MDKWHLVEEFERRFGSAPHRVVRAPGRVNLIGEHIDYNGGLVLPIAIGKEVRLAGSLRSDRRVRFHSLSFDEIFEGELPDVRIENPAWVNYLFGVIHELRKLGHDIPGCDVLVESSLPIASGLSSSAALEVAMAWFLRESLNLPFERLQLAELCQRAENGFVGMNCGLMDMAASLCCRKDAALKLDCSIPRTELVPAGGYEAKYLVAHSGVRRGLTKSAYNERRSQCESALLKINEALGGIYTHLCEVPLDALHATRSRLSDLEFRRAHHVITEQFRVGEFVSALAAGDYQTLGRILNESHTSLAVDYEVSCPELDDLAAFLRSTTGVYGSRLTGAGFGGCTISLVAASRAGEVSTALERYYREREGKEEIFFFSSAEEGASAL